MDFRTICPDNVHSSQNFLARSERPLLAFVARSNLSWREGKGASKLAKNTNLEFFIPLFLSLRDALTNIVVFASFHESTGQVL